MRGAQIALGVGEIAVFDAQRHLPEIIGDLDEIGVGTRRRQPLRGDPQPKIDAGADVESVGLDHQGVERGRNPAPVVGMENEIAALFDEGAGERLDERLLRQGHVTGSLLPSLPPSSRAISVISTLAPAQGWSERSMVVSAAPSSLPAGGICSEAFGGSTSERVIGPAVGDDRIGEGRLGVDRAVIVG